MSQYDLASAALLALIDQLTAKSVDAGTAAQIAADFVVLYFPPA